MTPDRDTLLAAAQQLADQNQYGRALEEYRKLLSADPNDARTLLKVGDLQMRAADYGGAIATYDRVARLYADQGFALKAVAVYKQIRELLLTQRPDLLPSFGHVLEHLVQLSVGLGLPLDAMQLLDEEATRLRRAGAEEGALEVYKRMTAVAPATPLPHLRVAESLCRVGRLDDALTAFGTASQLLLAADRKDDALRVMERMLHFRSDPQVAFAAATLYVEKGTIAEGMQALSRIQVCFQADPNNLEVLELLARAFDVIEQPEKATEVRKEITRLAQDQGNTGLFGGPVKSGPAPGQAAQFESIAPGESASPPPVAQQPEAQPALQARRVPAMPPPKTRRLNAAAGSAPSRPGAPPSRPASVAPEFVAPPSAPAAGSVPMPPPLGSRPSLPPPPPLSQAASSSPVNNDDHVARLSREIAAASERLPATAHLAGPASDALDDMDLVEDDAVTAAVPSTMDALPPRPAGAPVTAAAPLAAGAPSLGTGHPMPSRVPPRTTANVNVATHTHEALAKAQSYRLRAQFVAAVETLQLALDVTPRSIEIREALRDVYAESGNREGAIDEMLTMAAIYIEYGRPDHAGTVLRNILEAEPNHPQASQALAGLSRVPLIQSSRPPAALAAQPGPPRPKPAIPIAGSAAHGGHSAGGYSAAGYSASTSASVEESLEEAEFFASRGLYGDARRVLRDQLESTPGNPLVQELLAEIEQRLPQRGDNAERRDSDFNLKDQLNELGRVVRESQVPPRPGAPKPDVDVEAVFQKFKQGVRAQVSDADAATHYDLGLAYKDMGLVEDAVEELKLAARDVDRECNCYAMIGLIYAEQKAWEQSRKFYSKGLGAVRRTANQETTLYYELGYVSEMAEHLDQAAYYFRQVLRRDPKFRDARERLSKLRTSWAPPETKANGTQDEDVDRAFDELLNDAE